MLQVKNLSFKYNEQNDVLDNINYTFEEGTVYAILGKSGAGKSTLISLLSGLEKNKNGTIKLNESDEASEKNLLENVTVIFQGYNLIETYNVRDNLRMAQFLAKSKVDDQRIKEVLNEVEIDEKFLNKKIGELSGGQQQRIGIARAMLRNTNILVADEPTGNLDNETQEVVIDLLKEQATKHNKVVIIVTHSNEVANAADKVLNLANKKLVEIK